MPVGTEAATIHGAAELAFGEDAVPQGVLSGSDARSPTLSGGPLLPSSRTRANRDAVATVQKVRTRQRRALGETPRGSAACADRESTTTVAYFAFAASAAALATFSCSADSSGLGWAFSSRSPRIHLTASVIEVR